MKNAADLFKIAEIISKKHHDQIAKLSSADSISLSILQTSKNSFAASHKLLNYIKSDLKNT